MKFALTALVILSIYGLFMINIIDSNRIYDQWQASKSFLLHEDSQERMLSNNATYELAIGPFEVTADETAAYEKSNVTESQTGTPVRYTLTIVKNGSLLPNARLDFWCANATGVYSGVSVENTLSEDYLRGWQESDANGLITFQAVYPGQYSGRTNHIHFRIREYATDSAVETTYDEYTQLFFPADLNEAIKTVSPYSQTNSSNWNTDNSNDTYYTPQNQMTLNGSTTTNFTATYTIYLPLTESSSSSSSPFSLTPGNSSYRPPPGSSSNSPSGSPPGLPLGLPPNSPPGSPLELPSNFSSGSTASIKDDDDYITLIFTNLDTDVAASKLVPVNVTSEIGSVITLDSYIAIPYTGSNGNITKQPQFKSEVQIGGQYEVAFNTGLPVLAQWQFNSTSTSDNITLKLPLGTRMVRIEYHNGTLATQKTHHPKDTYAFTSADTCGTYMIDAVNNMVYVKLTSETDCIVLSRQTRPVKALVRHGRRDRFRYTPKHQMKEVDTHRSAK